jgi:hypothetical protein
VVVAELEQLPVGWQLHRGLEVSRGMAMDAATGIRVAVLWSMLDRHTAAQSMVPVAEAVDASYCLATGTGKTPGEIVAETLAVELKVPVGTALEWVGLTADATSRLDRAWIALDRGQISLQHFKRLARIVSDVSPRVADAVEAAVMPHQLSKPWTPAKLAGGREGARDD